MSITSRYLIGAALGLGLVGFLANRGMGEETFPATLPAKGLTPVGRTAAISPQLANQQLADTVAQTLRPSDKLRGFRVDIEVVNGEVELQGHVANAEQREEVIRLVQAVPGVVRVRDQLAVGQERAIIKVLNEDPPFEQGPLPKKMDRPPAGGSEPGIQNVYECWTGVRAWLWAGVRPRRHGELRTGRRGKLRTRRRRLARATSAIHECSVRHLLPPAAVAALRLAYLCPI